MKNIVKIFCIISLFITNVVYADIKFWTTEVQPARMAKQEEMAKAFEAKTGIKVDVIPIEEKIWALEQLQQQRLVIYQM